MSGRNMYRGRGGRGRSFQNCFEEGESSRRGNFRGRPPGLKGKQIGLYYKNMASKRKEEEKDDRRLMGSVFVPESTRNEIMSLLNSHKDLDESTIGPNVHFQREFERIVNGDIESKLASMPTEDTSRKPALDQRFFEEHQQKITTNPKYKKMLAVRQKLPSYEKREDIVRTIEENRVVLISGETGCGKTTQVAQFILDDYLARKEGSLCRVVCTQPRRISAISIAKRVAEERAEACGGGSVGYQIRLEKQMPRERGSILYCTIGVVLKQMESDPFLRDISHLILDEIHERDITSDFILALMKGLIKRRSTPKLILMSATLNAENFARYFDDCTTIHIPGFTYPVEQFYLEDVLQLTGHQFEPYRELKKWQRFVGRTKEEHLAAQMFELRIQPYIQKLARTGQYSSQVCENLSNPNSEKLDLDLVQSLLEHISYKEPPGAILVFLPGYQDITKLYNSMSGCGRFPIRSHLVLPLHSRMATAEQSIIFDRPPDGIRKIILSTNIAETSVTIDDIVYVVDCGKIKIKSFDADNNVETLKAEWVAEANAAQRKGRAGRVQEGVCYHLFTKARQGLFEAYHKPEILRTRLENVVLTVKILQLGKVRSFLGKLIDPPSEKAIDLSLDLLQGMEALDSDERLTPLGFHLARLPVSPQMGKMILFGAIFSCLDPILSIAASLDFKDAFQLPLGKEKEADEKKLELAKGALSDHILLHNAFSRWEQESARGSDWNFCRKYFISGQTMRLLKDMKGQLAEYLREMGFLPNSDYKSGRFNANSGNESMIKAVVCAGLYPNLAILKSIRKYGRKRILTLSGEKVELHPGSVNSKALTFPSPFLVYNLKQKSTSTFLHDTSMVYPLPLVFFGGNVASTDIGKNSVIVINDQIRLKCELKTQRLICQLKEKLNLLLKYKITNPGVVDWRSEGAEATLLNAIFALITLEDLEEMGYESSDDD